MATISARPFRLALLQLGPCGKAKAANIDLARRAVSEAAASHPKPQLIVLPEIWNSPYAVGSFREYSERVPEPGSRGEGTEGETVVALRQMARDAGCWLIGGGCGCERDGARADKPGSIPEREDETDHIYNSCTVYDPEGSLVCLGVQIHTDNGRQDGGQAPQGPPLRH